MCAAQRAANGSASRYPPGRVGGSSMARLLSEDQRARPQQGGARDLFSRVQQIITGPYATELRFAVAATAIGFVVLVAGTAANWPGPRSDCLGNFCYCEAPRGGVITQPANTLSNLAPVGMAFFT